MEQKRKNENVKRKKKVRKRKQKKTRYNKKKIFARIVLVCLFFSGISFAFNKFSSANAVEIRNERLSVETLSGMVEKTSKEASKGPLKTSGKTVYITIDDGPSKYTDQMLKILEKYNAKATFFMIDGNMRRYPQQVKNVANSTSTAGFHSVSHDVHKLYRSADSAKKEFDQCSKTYTEITGKTSKVIRIPYGSKPYTTKASYDAMVSAGYKIWDWNVDTNDWKNSSAGIMDVVKTYGNGQNVILLMHEKPQTIEAFEQIIKYYSDQGYEFAAAGQNENPKNFWLQNLSLN